MVPRRFANITARAGARLLGSRYLAAAAQAAGSFKKGGRSGSLHDLRVALRRLETCLAAYRDLFGGPVKQERKRLKKLLHFTSRVRDLEVELLWLEEHRAVFTPGAYAFARKALKRRKTSSLRKLRGKVVPAFGGFARRMSARLAARGPAVEAAGKGNKPFSRFTAKLCLEYYGRLETEMAAVASWKADRKIHRARIAAKRLRYLAEPLAAARAAGKAVKALKKLQGLLGEMHDLHVLEAELPALSAAGGAGGRAPGPRAAAEAARLRRRELFLKLKKYWRGLKLGKIFGRMHKTPAADPRPA